MFQDLTSLEDLSTSSMESVEDISLSPAEIDYLQELRVSPEQWEKMSQSDQFQCLDSINSRFNELSPRNSLSSVFEDLFGRDMYETWRNYEGLTKLEAPGDLEQISLISDVLSECEELRYDNWIKLSDAEKTNVMNELEIKISEIECRPACPISFADLSADSAPGSICLGGYRPGTKDIQLNEDLLSNKPDMYHELIDTLIHEGRHAYQDYNIHVHEVHPRHSEVGSWADTWGDGKWTYCSDCRTTLGQRLYEQQSIEIDARNFAGDVVSEYMKNYA